MARRPCGDGIPVIVVWFALAAVGWLIIAGVVAVVLWLFGVI